MRRNRMMMMILFALLLGLLFVASIGTARAYAKPAAAAPAGYTLCANENGTCTFNGTASVAYGANTSFNYKTANNSIGCNNATFGDPISGTAKACYYKLLGPAGYIFCANENATCSFSGTASVAYGANGLFNYKTATNSIGCNNATFGDPISGVAKGCYYQISGGPAGYTFCANENGTCSFSGTASVAYGANGLFNYKTATNSIGCNNATFGDPISGVAKACYYSSASFWGDTSSIPAASNVLMLKFLNRTNGKYPDSQVYWSFNGVTHSIAEQPYFDMPANSAGRMYFYLGSPTSQYTDFIEFTVGPGVFNGNTTRVDWFGIKLAMRLHAADGYDQAVGEDLTTFQEDRAVTFQKFINEVPAEFKHLAQNWAPYRISAPGKMGDVDFTPSGVYANYYTSYAQSVGVNASVFDIMACAGTLANNAAMCSALNRHVAHLAQSQWTTSSLFYQAAPANYYAKFWHAHSIGGLAYGFPYDDYGSYSSFVSHTNPQWLLVAVGW